MKNPNSLDTLAAALAYAMGIEPPVTAAKANPDLVEFVDKAFDGRKADRIVMYNPDAVAQWIYEKYSWFCASAKNVSDVEIPLSTVMPSVTPVCFATMYTGVQPEIHGIKTYAKPVVKTDSLFDALVRAGKKVALVTYSSCSLSAIFLERDIDYYHFPDGRIEDANAKVMELITRDEYDFIAVYNGNYDSVMHKKGPESPEALAELRLNSSIYTSICRLVESNYKNHDTLVGFAMDHGCHEIDGGCGSHGLDMDEDINIVHLYKAVKREG